MRDEKGVCQFFSDGSLVIKTKFATEDGVKQRMNVLKTIGTLIPGSVIYRCKECNFWHFGTTEQKDKYGR